MGHSLPCMMGLRENGFSASHARTIFCHGIGPRLCPVGHSAGDFTEPPLPVIHLPATTNARTRFEFPAPLSKGDISHVRSRCVFWGAPRATNLAPNCLRIAANMLARQSAGRRH